MRLLFVLSVVLCLAADCVLKNVPIGSPVPPTAGKTSHVLPHVGYLAFGSPVATLLDLTNSFKQGLVDGGYVEGQNIVVDYRYAEGNADRLEPLLSELLAIPVDLLVMADALTVPIAKKTTRTVPLVMAVSGDPVAEGLVDSLARPGGNLTGLSNMSSTLSAKRVELLQDIAPDVSHLAVLVNNDNPTGRLQLEQTLQGAGLLGIQAYPLPVQTPDDVVRAFETMQADNTDGIIALPDAVTSRERVRIAQAAVAARIPTMFGVPEAVEAGGLLAYGPDRKAMFRRAATYVDKIIRGTDPATLPIEQPTRFELAVNRKTAEALGLSVPNSLLLDATQVVQ